jgi:hypothetical protein
MFYLDKVRSIKSTVTIGSFNVFCVVHQIISLIYERGMQFFRMSPLNLSVTVIYSAWFMLVIPPVIIGLQRISMTIGLKPSIFIYVFDLQYYLQLLLTFGLPRHALSTLRGGCLQRVLLGFIDLALSKRSFSCC